MPLTETGVGLLDSGPPHWRELDDLLQRYYAMRLKATLVLMELRLYGRAAETFTPPLVSAVEDALRDLQPGNVLPHGRIDG